MHKTVIEFNKSQRPAEFNLRAGDVVAVHRRITEGNKERIQVFEGMILAVRGGQSSSPMITVRKISGGVGVEIVVPVFSPQIEKIDLIKRAKVRRAKLYYTRSKPAKKLRFKFTDAAQLEKENKKKISDTDAKSSSEKTQNDDLTKIEGIGPKIAAVLNRNGVNTFAALADLPSEKIAEMIEDVPGNHVVDTWSKQAVLARDGKWEELKKWQEELVGGVDEKAGKKEVDKKE